MGKTVFDVLEEKIVETRASRELDMARGTAEDFASYKEMCGVIQGLNLALREVQDLSRANKEDGDDD